MNKLKNVGLNTLVYFFYFFGGCVVVMFAEAMLMFLVDKFVALPYFTLAVIRIVIYSLGIPAVVGVLGYFEGYREASCHVGETILGGLAAEAIPHFLMAALFHFQPFASGAVRFCAGLMVAGSSFVEEDLKSTTPLQLIGFFVLYAVIYIAVLTVAKYLGASKRIVDRASLRRGEAVPPAGDEING